MFAFRQVHDEQRLIEQRSENDKITIEQKVETKVGDILCFFQSSMTSRHTPFRFHNIPLVALEWRVHPADSDSTTTTTTKNTRKFFHI